MADTRRWPTLITGPSAATTTTSSGTAQFQVQPYTKATVAPG